MNLAFRYTPQDHIVRLTSNLLGSELWEPSSEIIEVLLSNLSPKERLDRFLIREKLIEFENRRGLGHETKISYTLTNRKPYQMTPEDKENLLNEFELWWHDLAEGETNMNISEFIDYWAMQRGIHPAFTQHSQQ